MIVAGFGFRRNANADSLLSAYDVARDGRDAEVFATLDTKAGDLAFGDVALTMGSQRVSVSLAELQAQTTVTKSASSEGAYGTGSVAEAAALAAAGPGSKLLAPRSVSADGMATCALAEGQSK